MSGGGYPIPHFYHSPSFPFLSNLMAVSADFSTGSMFHILWSAEAIVIWIHLKELFQEEWQRKTCREARILERKIDPCQQQPLCCSFLKFWNYFTSKRVYASPMQCCPSSSHQGGLNAFPTWGCFWWHTLNNQAVYWATECVVAHNCYKRRWDPPLSWWKPSWALPCSLHLDQDPTAAGSEQCVHGLIPF